MAEIPSYRFQFTQRVEWGDMDALRHVNNVSFARYFENARAHFFRHLAEVHGFRMPDNRAMFMTAVQLRYRRQVVFPAELKCTVGLTGLHVRGMEVGCSMWTGDDDCAVNGVSHHMWIDTRVGRPARMPEELRAVAERLLETPQGL